jgi:carboxypeptidase family protein
MNPLKIVLRERNTAPPAPPVNIHNIRIASPCSADWNKMIGDERVRHCGGCNLNVYNLSAMTEREVQRLIAGSNGRLCTRFYRRADGTILKQDCPRGLRAVARRVSRTVAALVSAVMSVSFAVAGTKPKPAQQTEQNQCREPGITLVVMDPQDAVIQNAEVTLTDRSGKQRHAKTNSVGRVILHGVRTGEYVLEVRSPGFRISTQLIPVQEGKLLDLKLKLPLVETKTEVIVEAHSVSAIMGGEIGVTTTTYSGTLPPAQSGGRPQPMR